MTKMSQGNKKITAGKLPAANNKILVCTDTLTKFALFQEMPSINYKISVRTGTGTQDNSNLKLSWRYNKIKQIENDVFVNVKIRCTFQLCHEQRRKQSFKDVSQNLASKSWLPLMSTMKKNPCE